MHVWATVYGTPPPSEWAALCKDECMCARPTPPPSSSPRIPHSQHQQHPEEAALKPSSRCSFTSASPHHHPQSPSIITCPAAAEEDDNHSRVIKPYSSSWRGLTTRSIQITGLIARCMPQGWSLARGNTRTEPDKARDCIKHEPLIRMIDGEREDKHVDPLTIIEWMMERERRKRE